VLIYQRKTATEKCCEMLIFQLDIFEKNCIGKNFFKNSSKKSIFFNKKYLQVRN